VGTNVNENHNKSDEERQRVSKSVCGKREGERDKARGERKL
jgi:hypothetical protein